MEATPPALEVDELDVPFGDARGLSRITFSVRAGERFALVGASGSGKTSLLRAIAGTVPTRAGRVRVAGDDVSGRPTERRDVVLLAQTPLLFPHLSVFENVAFPLRVRGIAPADLRERVEAALAAVRLETFGTRRPHTLSGGQARRVALARAVVARPAVLLLDEPLAALDPALRDEVRRTILDVHEGYRPALVVVTHDLAEAGRIGDRIGVLLDGTLAQVGSPGVLFRHPATASVARFLGLENELQGEVGEGGELRVTGRTVGTVPGAPTGPVTVIFGADGAALESSPRRSAGREGTVSRSGAPLLGTVVGVDYGPETVRARVELHGGATVAVGLAARLVPETGSRVGVRLESERLHVFGSPAGDGRDRLPHADDPADRLDDRG